MSSRDKIAGARYIYKATPGDIIIVEVTPCIAYVLLLRARPKRPRIADYGGMPYGEFKVFAHPWIEARFVYILYGLFPSFAL
jgi:hypothetical protein